MLGNYSHLPAYNPANRNPGGPLYQRTAQSQVWGVGCQPQIPQPLFYISIADIVDWGAKVVASPSGQSYNMTRLLGQGTFGQTYGCEQPLKDRKFAMKVIQYENPFEKKSVKKEVDALLKIRTYQPQESCLLSFYEGFEHGKEYCIVTEMLDINLVQYMEWRQFQPVPLEDLRRITHQVMCGLAELHGMGLVHCDLKPQNIMFVNYRQHGFRLKLIDFGNVNETHELRGRQGQMMQTATYRAPEILIGLPVNETIDQWSVGVTFIELYTGKRFLHGYSEESMMSVIARICGLPFESCEGLYFDRFGQLDVFTRKPVLHHFIQLAPESWYQESGLRNLHKYGDNTLRSGFATQEDLLFEMFVEKLMHIEPTRRPSAAQLLEDDFLKSKKQREMIEIRPMA